MHIGLFLIQLTVGALVLGHGAQKLLGWFGGAAVVALSGGGSVLALFRRKDAAVTPNPAAIAA